MKPVSDNDSPLRTMASGLRLPPASPPSQLRRRRQDVGVSAQTKDSGLRCVGDCLDLNEISRSVLSTPGTRMEAHSAGTKMPQLFLYQSLWFRASRARQRDTGCARNEDLVIYFATDGFFSSRSRDPSRRGGARRLPPGSSTQSETIVPIQVDLVWRLTLAAA